jgi:hypothetical protein
MKVFASLYNRLVVWGLRMATFWGLATLPELPFRWASFLHRKHASKVLNGAALEWGFADAADRFGIDSEQAAVVEEKVSSSDFILQLGRLINTDQERWYRQAFQSGIPINVLRCFCVNLNVKKSGEFRFDVRVEYGVAAFYCISVILALAIFVVNIAPLVVAWPYALFYEKAGVVLLYIAVVSSLVTLGYFALLPTYYYQKYISCRQLLR